VLADVGIHFLVAAIDFDAHAGAIQKGSVERQIRNPRRHTWATRAVMCGIDLVTLAAMLGHSRIQMVLRYAHPTEQHQAEAGVIQSRVERRGT
jgi:integrase